MKQRLIFIFILSGLALLYYLNTLYWEKDTVDDSFITYRYSRNLARGEGLTYNQGAKVEGYSNFFWVLLHAFPIRYGADPIHISRILSLFGGLILLAVLLITLRSGRGGITMIGAAAAVYLALNPFLGLWTMVGMETVWYTMLLVTGIYFLAGGWNRRGYLWSAVLLSLACLTRPEGTFIVAAICGYQLFLIIRRRKVSPPQLRWGAILFGIVGLYYIWRLVYFGDILPNTYYAKLGGQLSLWDRRAGFIYLRDYFLISGWAFGAYLAGGIVLILKFDYKQGLAWIFPAAAGIFFAYYSNGDWMPNFRFLVPVLPMLLAAASLGFIRLGEKRGERSARAAGFSPWVTVAGLVLLGAALVKVYPLDAVWMSELSRQFRPKRSLFSFLKTRGYVGYDIWTMAAYPALYHVRPGELISLGDIGVVGYILDCEILDTNGLVDKRIAHLPRDGNYSQAIGDYFLAREPEVVFLLTRGEEGPIQGVGMIGQAILNSNGFLNRWKQVARSRAIGDTWYTVFRRIGTLDLTPEEVENNFKIAAEKLPGAPWFRLIRATEITSDTRAAVEECRLLRKDFRNNKDVRCLTEKLLTEENTLNN
jgi:arabinofuranosyltransferase